MSVLKLPQPLETDRLVIRLPSLDDSPQYFELFSDPEALKFWSEVAWTVPETASTRVARLIEMNEAGQSLSLCIEMRKDQKLIGTLSLFNWAEQSRRAEIGYFIGRKFWRQGFGFEAVSALILAAFGELDLNRLEADIHPDNVASEQLLKKLGFQKEGYMRDRWIVAGIKSDTAFFGLLRPPNGP